MAQDDKVADKEMVEAVRLLVRKMYDDRLLGADMEDSDPDEIEARILAFIRRSPADDTWKGWRLVKIADLATILALLPPKPLVKNGLMYMYADPEPGDRLHQIRDAFDTMLSNVPPAG